MPDDLHINYVKINVSILLSDLETLEATLIALENITLVMRRARFHSDAL